MAKVRKRQWTTTAGERRSAWAVDFTDAAGQRQRRQFGTKRAADSFRVEIEGQLRAGTFRADAAKISVRDAAEAFLEHCEGRHKRGERMTQHHLVNVRSRIAGHVLHPRHGVGGLNLAALTTRAVADFRDRLRSAGVSVAMTRKAISTLHAMLAWCVERDLVAVNAARGVKVIGRRDEGSKRIEPPPKADVLALLRQAERDDPDFRVVLLTAALTGVRAGELHALRWRHLDLAAGVLTVETRVDRYRDEDVPKTAAGVRQVPLSAALIRELKAWQLRSRWSHHEDLLFPNSRGGFADHSNMIRRRFEPLCDRAGVARFNWHALRHFAVSCWIEAGLSPKATQTIAGHASLTMTMDLYGHLFPSEDHRVAMDTIAGALAV